MALFDAKFSGPGAAQRGQRGGHTQGCADVLGQHADIGALGATHPQGIIAGGGAAQIFNAVHSDGPGRALDSLALACGLIQRLAVDFDR